MSPFVRAFCCHRGVEAVKDHHPPATEALSPEAWGLYLHIPFCERKCPYCDFTIAVLAHPPELPYIDAMEREMVTRSREYRGKLSTIYVGGGTPGMLSPASVHALGASLDRVFGARSLDEFTVEFNPEHADEARLRAWYGIGARRLSLGVQALDARALQLLGREHDEALVRAAVARARAIGFEHISVDFIFGLPGIDAAVTLSDVARGVAIEGVDHVSMYELTIEPRTLFGVQQRRGLLTSPPDDDIVAQWGALVRVVEAAGLARYEVSNYARPAAKALHNSSYWRGRPYLGVGVGASSLWVSPEGAGVRRQTNVRALRAYLQDPLAGAEVEALTPSEHLGELLALGLRTREGVALASLERRFGLELPVVEGALQAMAREGTLTASAARTFGATDEGMAIADTLALRALEALDSDLRACVLG